VDWNPPASLLTPSTHSRALPESKEHPLVKSFVGQFLLVDDEAPGGSEDNFSIRGTTCTDSVRDGWGRDGAQLLRCIVNNILRNFQGPSEGMYSMLPRARVTKLARYCTLNWLF
jgi:hypothetical protein